MFKAPARVFVCLSLFVVLTSFLATTAIAQTATPLAPGSIQVSRVQYDGNSFGNTDGFPYIFSDPNVSGIQGSIFIDQFTSVPESVVSGSLSLPASGNSYITSSFSSKSEGALMLSPNGNFLTYMGYQGVNEIEGVSNSYTTLPAAQLNPNTPPNYNREVALIGANGLISLTPEVNAYSGDNPRAAITVDGNEFYMAGNSDSTTYKTTPVTGPGTTIGARCDGGLTGTSYQLGTYVASDRPDESAKQHFKDNNWRGIGIYNGNLYVSKGSGGNGDDGVFQVENGTGSGLPSCTNGGTDTGNTIVELFGAQATNPTNSNIVSQYVPFGFWFANPTTLYVADEGYANLDSNGNIIPDALAGLEKWSLVNGTWRLQYTIQAGLNLYQPQTISGYPVSTYPTGLRNMTGSVNGDGTVTIYAITAQYSTISGGEPDPTSLVGITDSLAATSLPANEQFVTLQNSGSAEVYRGVAFVPSTAARQSQTITFPSVGTVTFGTAPITLAATATSGWPIAYAVTSGPAKVSGNILTITGAGQVTVTADQSGNTDYTAAQTVTQTFTVNQATPSITWAAPVAITYGTPLSGAQLNATANVAGTFSYNPAYGTVLNAGNQILSVLFTPTDSTDYSTANASVPLVVNQAPSSITWSNPSPITYGTALSATQLNATANVAGNFVYSPAAGAVLNAGSQMLNVTFNPSSTNYSSSTASVSLTVNQASQSISFSMNAPISAAYGSSFTVAASATSGLTIAYGSSGACTNSGPIYTITSGSGTCTVTASQAGNSNYLPASSVSESTAAGRANQTVSFTGAPPTAPYNGTFTLLASTNSTASAFITTSNSSVCSLSGPYSPVTVTILKSSGSCKFTASWGADANYAPATATLTTVAVKASPVITWAPPASITYGTPLSGTQLDASANMAGTFTYTPAVGKIENTGTDTLKVSFKPSDPNFAIATATVPLQVQPAATTTTITSSNATVKLNASGIASATLAFNVASYRPTGAVTLTASTGEVCSGTLNSSGNGSCKLTFDTTGTRTITASYEADINHTGSNSSGQNPPITVTVNAN